MWFLWQMLYNLITQLGFILILFLANQTTSLTWSLDEKLIVNGFLKLDIVDFIMQQFE